MTCQAAGGFRMSFSDCTPHHFAVPIVHTLQRGKRPSLLTSGCCVQASSGLNQSDVEEVIVACNQLCTLPRPPNSSAFLQSQATRGFSSPQGCAGWSLICCAPPSSLHTHAKKRSRCTPQFFAHCHPTYYLPVQLPKTKSKHCTGGSARWTEGARAL